MGGFKTWRQKESKVQSLRLRVFQRTSGTLFLFQVGRTTCFLKNFKSLNFGLCFSAPSFKLVYLAAILSPCRIAKNVRGAQDCCKMGRFKT
jgi:uncharacterized membrane protein (UPF0127 family)